MNSISCYLYLVIQGQILLTFIMFRLAPATGANEMPQYQFLTNHAQVLLCVAYDPGIRLRDIAQTVGIARAPSEYPTRHASTKVTTP